MSEEQPKPISDREDPLIRRVKALETRNARDNEAVYFVEGVRMVLDAERVEADIDTIIYSPQLLKSGAARKAIKRLRGEVTIETVTPEVFRHISTARRASGVAAIVKQTWRDLAALEAEPGEFWLGVRHLRSTGNFGTVARTVAAMNGAGMILFGDTLDPYDPDVIRASMGGIIGMPFTRTTHQDLAARSDDFAIVGAATGGRPIYEVDFTRPTIVMLGHERHGLTDEEEALCDELVEIPQPGRGTSLNAGVAASIFAYEAARQLLTSNE